MQRAEKLIRSSNRFRRPRDVWSRMLSPALTESFPKMRLGRACALPGKCLARRSGQMRSP